jgi:hypothetical protein
MCLKLTSIAAPAAFSIGIAVMGSVSVRAMDEETIRTPDVAPPHPACTGRQIFDIKSNACIASSTVVTCDKGLPLMRPKRLASSQPPSTTISSTTSVASSRWPATPPTP